MNRREFIGSGILSGLGFATLLGGVHLARGAGRAPAWPAAGRLGLLRPPGSLDEEAFNGRCIRCQRCSQACDARAIELFGDEAGALAGTPYILPERHGCNLCLRCGEACPTGAIEVLGEKALARMGLAVVDELRCVSHNGTGICGACFTACPLKRRAITQSAHNRPEIHADECVGCGMCEEVCIVDGDKAIRVFSERGWPS